MLAADLVDPTIAGIVEDVWQHGWSVCPGFLTPQESALLAAECERSWRDGEFRQAGVGIGEELRVDRTVRRDYVHWMAETALTPAQHSYWLRLDALRQTLNRELTLGLFSYEGHLTVYPPGAFYRKHLDQFQRVAYRQVSCILYLNQDWQEDDGGQLRIYLDEAGQERWVDVAPRGGTLVVFMSARFWHEVLPARRERMSWTGWFRRRE